MLRTLVTIFDLVIFSTCLYSQSFGYSKNYFRWPVDVKPAIVANFGELRSNHWHMGLDIRTNHRVNIPVHAAADGYIARISVKPFSYGQAIYINHPNGLTTVYGHLNKFFSRLDSFVTAEQYKQESWELDLEFAPDQFPVKKGQFIAYSGSTGASGGPHVHFEIRDTKTERCINPFFFNLPIPDAVPPVFTKLAMYDRNISVYDQNPELLAVKRTKNGYLPAKGELIKTGFSKLSFAIGAHDCVSGMTNPNGIYSAKISFDDDPLIEFVMDSMDYDETDYVNAHIDYKYRYRGGSYLQQLFKLPGDNGRDYRLKSGDGIIDLTGSKVHEVVIEISDIKGNTSSLKFKVQYDRNLSSQVNYKGHRYFVPNYVNVFEQNDFEVYLPENCLYDSIQPVFYRTGKPASNAVSARFQFCDAYVPFHGLISIRIKPNADISASSKNKIVIKQTDSKGTSFKKAEWERDWLAARFGDFGSYQAFIDDQPPTINELGRGDTVDFSASKRIVFYPKDNTGIKSFRVELDGQWLRFTNDKAAAWIYYFDERCPLGVHRLTVRIEDIAGNVTRKEWWFKRHPYTPPKKKPVHKRTTHKLVKKKK